MSTTVLAAFVVTWTLLIVLAALVMGTLRYLGAIQSRLEAAVPRHPTRLVKGDAISTWTLPTADGALINTADLVGRRLRTLFLVLNDQCQSCEIVAKQIAELAARDGGFRRLGWQVIMAWTGDPELAAKKSSFLPDDERITVLFDRDNTVARDLLVRSFPIGIALDQSGKMTDQSAHPGPNWIYITLDVPAPEAPLADAGWVPLQTTRG